MLSKGNSNANTHVQWRPKESWLEGGERRRKEEEIGQKGEREVVRRAPSRTLGKKDRFWGRKRGKEKRQING